MVVMSKLQPGAPSTTFAPADLAGPWRVYLQRVESKLSAGTWQVGQTTFGATGLLTGGSLQDMASATTTLTTGSLLVSANGSVSGTLAAGPGVTVDRYTITGTMRAAKDLITGVVTAQIAGPPAQTHYGIVTLVREVALLDIAQSAYSVTEGGTATVTVLRSGNRTRPSTVTYLASGGTAPGADYQPAAGTLSFAPNAGSAIFTVKTNPNTLVDGNRSVNLVLTAAGGTGALLGTTTAATLNIVDEDKGGTVKLGAATYTVAEAGKTVGITLQRSLGAASGVVVQFATSDGTAEAGRDYTATSGSVTFNAGETTKTVHVPITNTTVVDGSRTFTFELTGATPPGTVIGTPDSALVTITDNDVAGALQFSAAAYSVTEPAAVTATAVITVSRAGGTAGGVLVSFTTADGTATAGPDYTAASGTLSFGAGNTSATFSIPIAADALVEGDETVLLTLTDPLGGATLGAQKTALLTIRDAQRGLQFSASNYTVNESQATATITVARSGPTTGSATVGYSTSDGTAVGGTHYTPTSGVLTFASGATSKTFAVKVLPDKVVAGPKTVLLLLSTPLPDPDMQLGARSAAVLTINDVDVAGTVKLGAATYSVKESLAAATITVTRSGGTAGGVTVKYATADQPGDPGPTKAQVSVDYEEATGTLTFGPGETTKTILVPITGDALVEGNETFLFQLSDPQGGATLGSPSTAVVTITDDDQGGVIQLQAATFSVTEPAAVSTTATIKVTRTGTNLAGGASVQFATSNGTATSGPDYVATVTTLVFGAGETFKNVPIPVLPDADAEGNETVGITLSNPGGGATLGALTSGVLTIVDATQSTRFSASTYSVTEGAVASITVLRGGPLTGVLKVDYSTSDGTASVNTDYKAAAGTLTFSANVASRTFTVPTINTAAVDGDRTVNLTLTAVLGGAPVSSPSTATLTIADNDAPGTLQFGAATYAVAEGGMSPVMITRTGGSGGTVLVGWSVQGGGTATAAQDFTPAGGTLTFGPGVTSLRVPLTIVNDTLAEDAETVNLALALSGSPPAGATVGAQATTVLTLTDNDNGGAIRFASATATAAENVAGGKINLTVTRTGTALAGGVLVDYAASGDTAAVNLPMGVLTFAAGQLSLMLPVPIVSNGIAEADRTVVVTLSNPRSSGIATGANAPTITAVPAVPATTLTIVDDEPRLQFGDTNFNVTEGGTATITVVRTGSLAGQVTAGFTTADSTALAGVDYTTSAGTLTFGPNVAKQTFSVATADDPAATGSKIAALQLTLGTGASLGARSSATLTIQDGDSAGVVQFAAAASSVVEGGTVRLSVTRTGASLTGGVTVGWSATGGSATGTDDYSPLSGTLTFNAGVSTQNLDIAAAADALVEGTETIILSLSPPTGGATLGAASMATIFVIDAQQSVGFGKAEFTVGETTPQAVISVVRFGVPTGTITVNATTVTATAVPGLDYTETGRTLTFAAGETLKTLNVPILTANALTRNGNRVVGLELSNPVDAALGAADSATLTIMDFRPDLLVTAVSAPSSALTGKVVSAPTTVRNLGTVAAPAFRVGVFIAQSDNSAGAGQLLALRDVPGLAPGASMSLPTQITIAEDLPPGDYFVSAVADFQGSVGEGDESNNGKASAPSFLRVSKNLTKFQSASASFSLGDAGGGSSLLSGPAAACDVAGSVDLTGSFTITSQQQNTATGVADLTGSFNEQPVRFLLTFTGTADVSNNIAASLTSIVVSGAFSATGVGSPPGSLTGTLTVATLSGNATGTIQTSTGGDCVFTGPLTAIGQTSFVLRLGTRTSVGQFRLPEHARRSLVRHDGRLRGDVPRALRRQLPRSRGRALHGSRRHRHHRRAGRHGHEP